jgi:tripartite-type tricarboxylate transporter receptor subunit TctC
MWLGRQLVLYAGSRLQPEQPMPVVRQLRLLGAASLFFALLPGFSAQAQEYPTRSVRIVLPFAAGGATDVMARQIAQFLTGALGQPFVVENVVGAGGNVGTRLVARAEPDGYTLLFGTTSTFAINPAVYRNVGYDPLTSFTPVARAFDSGMMLVVHPSVPANSVRDLVSYAKTNPGRLNYGSSGVGTPMQVATELFKTMTDTNLVHVPYKGGVQSIQDTVAGQVQVLFENPLQLIPLVRDARLRALAVTSETRNPQAQDIPTMKEAGVEFTVTLINGVVAPAGTPPTIVNKLNGAINQALKSPQLLNAVANFGADARPDTPDNFRVLIAFELRRWAEVAKAAKIQIE